MEWAYFSLKCSQCIRFMHNSPDLLWVEPTPTLFGAMFYGVWPLPSCPQIQSRSPLVFLTSLWICRQVDCAFVCYTVSVALYVLRLVKSSQTLSNIVVASRRNGTWPLMARVTACFVTFVNVTCRIIVSLGSLQFATRIISVALARWRHFTSGDVM